MSECVSIAVVNKVARYTKAELKRMVKAMNIQLTRDLAPLWPSTNIPNVFLLEHEASLANHPEWWPCYILPGNAASWAQGAAGYHAIQSAFNVDALNTYPNLFNGTQIAGRPYMVTFTDFMIPDCNGVPQHTFDPLNTPTHFAQAAQGIGNWSCRLNYETHPTTHMFLTDYYGPASWTISHEILETVCNPLAGLAPYAQQPGWLFAGVNGEVDPGGGEGSPFGLVGVQRECCDPVYIELYTIQADGHPVTVSNAVSEAWFNYLYSLYFADGQPEGFPFPPPAGTKWDILGEVPGPFFYNPAAIPEVGIPAALGISLDGGYIGGLFAKTTARGDKIIPPLFEHQGYDPDNYFSTTYPDITVTALGPNEARVPQDRGGQVYATLYFGPESIGNDVLARGQQSVGEDVVPATSLTNGERIFYKTPPYKIR